MYWELSQKDFVFQKCSLVSVSETSFKEIKGQWKFSGDKHKSLQVDTERTFHQRYPLVML